jgi:prepilin-type N-terminal cleavage/methylation domain-containing protein/prepilin-type processing-associated H-X9-DG protein
MFKPPATTRKPREQAMTAGDLNLPSVRTTRPGRRLAPRAFTLIEVLVVVAIIALLIAVLMPGLASARASARHTQCLSNLHQFTTAIHAYATENKGIIPRGSSAAELHWTQLVARALGDRTYYRNCNLIPVEKRPMYHCPERVKTLARPFVDYVSNALDPNGPTIDRSLGQSKEQWNEVKFINISRYRRPDNVVFLCDAEREDRVKAGYSQSLKEAHDRGLGTDWTNASNWGSVSGIDAMDVWCGEQLPENKLNISDAPGPRRVARKMHLGRFLNAGFMDGHVGPLQLAPTEWGTDHIRRYAYWLDKFGVKDPQKVALKPLAP